MSVRAIGVDMVKISRISRILDSSRRDRFLQRVLHISERKTLTNMTPSRSSEFVAGSWAAKEAVYKTLDRHDQLRFQFSEWYRYKEDGKPGIGSDTAAPESSFLLSISHDGDMLIATALRLEAT